LQLGGDEGGGLGAGGLQAGEGGWHVEGEAIDRAGTGVADEPKGD